MTEAIFSSAHAVNPGIAEVSSAFSAQMGGTSRLKTAPIMINVQRGILG